MAFGMKSWVLTTLGGIGVAAVLFLPPGHVSDLLPERLRAREAGVRPAADRLVRMERRVRTLASPLVAIRLEPWVREKVEEVGEPGRLVVAGLESLEGTEEELRAIRERAAELYETSEVTGGEEAPVVALLFAETGDHAPPPADRTEGRHFYAGTLEDGTPYCARVLNRPAGGMEAHFAEREMWSRTEARGPLHQCQLWARYGVPGEEIRAWLDAGGYRLADGATPPTPERDLGVHLLRAMAAYRPERGATIQECLAGTLSECRRLIHPDAWAPGGSGADDGATNGGGTVEGATAPEEDAGSRSDALLRALVRETDLAMTGAEGGLFGIAPFERGMVAALEAEGAERFRAFWTSNEPFDVAFEDAFGVPPAEWVHHWLTELYGSDPPDGPAIALADLGLSLTLLVALVGAAVVTHRRRRVG